MFKKVLAKVLSAFSAIDPLVMFLARFLDGNFELL